MKNLKNRLSLILLGAITMLSVVFSTEASAQSSGLEPGVMTEVDEQPLPPGGMEGLYAYLAENMKYPKQAIERGIEGIVAVTFLVQKDGSLTDVEILRGIGGYCDEEAVRLIKAMDNWQPGKLKGEAVVARMRIPVRFTLPDSN